MRGVEASVEANPSSLDSSHWHLNGFPFVPCLVASMLCPMTIEHVLVGQQTSEVRRATTTLWSSNEMNASAVKNVPICKTCSEFQ